MNKQRQQIKQLAIWRKNIWITWVNNVIHKMVNEPPPDKTNKLTMRPAKTQISLGGCPGWSESSLGAQSFCWFWHEGAQMLFEFKRETDILQKNHSVNVKQGCHQLVINKRIWWSINVCTVILPFVWQASQFDFNILYFPCSQCGVKCLV